MADWCLSDMLAAVKFWTEVILQIILVPVKTLTDKFP